MSRVRVFAVLHKCANPDCSQPFKYFRHGKLFSVEMESRSGVPEKVQEIEGSALAVRKVCPAKTPFDPIYSAFIFTKSIMPPRSFPITKLPRSGPLYRARDAL